MPEDLILNSEHEPSMHEISFCLEEEVREKWLELTGFIEDNYKTKHNISYSSCSAKPGWNVKYKIKRIQKLSALYILKKITLG